MGFAENPGQEQGQEQPYINIYRTGLGPKICGFSDPMEQFTCKVIEVGGRPDPSSPQLCSCRLHRSPDPLRSRQGSFCLYLGCRTFPHAHGFPSTLTIALPCFSSLGSGSHSSECSQQGSVISASSEDCLASMATVHFGTRADRSACFSHGNFILAPLLLLPIWIDFCFSCAD